MFTRTLQTTADNMLSSTRRTKPVHARRDQTINETPWWDYEVTELKLRRNYFLNLFRRTNDHNVLLDYLNVKKSY